MEPDLSYYSNLSEDFFIISLKNFQAYLRKRLILDHAPSKKKKIFQVKIVFPN